MSIATAMTMTIGRAFAEASRKIDAIDARALLCHAVSCDQAYLAGHGEAALGETVQRVFEALVSRRIAGEPIAYLTGEREFFSLSFRITPAVLIPRPETELLVEMALAHTPRNAPCEVLDLGTGSGCVAISIAKHRPRARVTATDISRDALEIAALNARALESGNVVFAHGRWLEAVGDRRFDLIVSNPPYIPKRDPHLRSGDLRFEPRRALVDGGDGLNAIGEIIAAAGHHLIPDGRLMFEHGIGQAERCRVFLGAAGFRDIFSRRDLAGIERVTGGRLGGS